MVCCCSLTRPVADIFNSFKCGLLPVHLFFSADEPKPDEVEKTKSRKQKGEKWKTGFEERCKALGNATCYKLLIFQIFCFLLLKSLAVE